MRNPDDADGTDLQWIMQIHALKPQNGHTEALMHKVSPELHIVFHGIIRLFILNRYR